MKLYFSPNPEPRVAVAVARHLKAPIEFELAGGADRMRPERFRKLVPGQMIPILVEGCVGLWEADPIARRLSELVASDFWRTETDAAEMTRWLSWGEANFLRACAMVHCEREKSRRKVPLRARKDDTPFDPAKLAEGLALFAESARVLDHHLATHRWLLGEGLSYADFRLATFLPFNDVVELPLERYPALRRWIARLEDLPAWGNPFEGLLPPQ